MKSVYLSREFTDKIHTTFYELSYISRRSLYPLLVPKKNTTRIRHVFDAYIYLTRVCHIMPTKISGTPIEIDSQNNLWFLGSFHEKRDHGYVRNNAIVYPQQRNMHKCPVRDYDESGEEVMTSGIPTTFEVWNNDTKEADPGWEFSIEKEKLQYCNNRELIEDCQVKDDIKLKKFPDYPLAYKNKMLCYYNIKGRGSTSNQPLKYHFCISITLTFSNSKRGLTFSNFVYNTPPIFVLSAPDKSLKALYKELDSPGKRPADETPATGKLDAKTDAMLCNTTAPNSSPLPFPSSNLTSRPAKRPRGDDDSVAASAYDILHQASNTLSETLVRQQLTAAPLSIDQQVQLVMQTQRHSAAVIDLLTSSAQSISANMRLVGHSTPVDLHE